MSLARSKFARRHCALLLTAAIAASACADPADLDTDVESEKAAPPSALSFGLALMGHFNGVVSLLGTFGLDVSALIGGGDGTVTLSQESLDAIADIVDNALHAQYLTEGDASLQSLMTYQALYIRRACIGRADCTEFELDTMREDIGLVEEVAVDLYDRLNVLGDRRLQVGAPLMTAGASRLFALHETALLEATAGSSVATIERQIRDTADDILDDISDIESLYNSRVASQFSEGVTCTHNGRRCCYHTPRGESCSSRGRGTAERLLNQAKTTWRAWTLGPEGQYQAFRRRLVQLKNGETIDLEPQDDSVPCNNRLNAGQTLSQGSALTACNGRFQLKAYASVAIQQLEEDDAGYITRTTIWETGTRGRHFGFQLTNDGQLQIRSRSYIWRAGVTAGAGAYALLHNDGEFVVYRSDDEAAWSSVDGLIDQPEPSVPTDRSVYLRAADADLAAHARGGSNRGAVMTLHSCPPHMSHPNCQWIFEPSPTRPGAYYIKSHGANEYLHTLGGARVGHHHTLHPCPKGNDHPNCQWYVEPSPTREGAIYLRSAGANLYFHTAGGSRNANRQTLHACPKGNDHPNCQWYVR